MSEDPNAEEAALRAVARRLAAADRLAPPMDDALLPLIAAATVSVLEVQAASIALHDRDSDRLIFVAAAGPATGDVVGLAIESGAGIAGYAFTTGQPLAVADVSTDPRFDRSVAEATGYLPGSLLATPLSDDDGTVGVLEALDRRGGTFTLRDLDVAAALARVATAAVRSGRLGRDAGRLVAAALADVARSGEGPTPLDGPAIESIVGRATAGLATDDDDPLWRLADRLARLREVDPESLELAVDWLDVLLRHRDADGRGGRGGPGR